MAGDVVDPRFRSLAKAELSERIPGDLVPVADIAAEVRIVEVLSGP